MKLSHVLNAVFCEPWLIRPQMHQQICRIVMAHVNGTAHAVGGIVEQIEPDDDDKMPGMHDNGVAVIPVKGVIGRGVSAIEKSSGVCDVDDVSAMLEWCEQAAEVKSIVLDIDSPGGSVQGVPELAAQINRITKPIIAHSSGMCCSAAYWFASQCQAIYCTESAVMGSIGVYLPIMDSSEAYKAAGLKQEVIKAGKYKGAGLPGTSLTDDQRAQLQERVNQLYAMFTAAVRSGRGNVADETMQGQDFYGRQSVAIGLVDSVADIRKAIADAAYLSVKQ